MRVLFLLILGLAATILPSHAQEISDEELKKWLEEAESWRVTETPSGARVAIISGNFYYEIGEPERSTGSVMSVCRPDGQLLLFVQLPHGTVEQMQISDRFEKKLVTFDVQHVANSGAPVFAGPEAKTIVELIMNLSPYLLFEFTESSGTRTERRIIPTDGSREAIEQVASNCL